MSPDVGRSGFQYSVLRCVPRAEREEFINIGVLLYCQDADFLRCASSMQPARLAALAPGLDIAHVSSAVAAIQAVCVGDVSAGQAASLALGPRFGWLCAPRSTVVRPGPVHGGLTRDPAAQLESLLRAEVGG